MISERKAMSKRLEEDFFRDLVPITAVEIARDVAESSALRGQQFDEEVRWGIQREIEKFLADNPSFRTAIFDQNRKNRGRAVLALKELYRKFVAQSTPILEVIWDRSR